MYLTYPGHIAPEDITGRVMGPDLFDGYVQAVAVEHSHPSFPPRTRVRFVPVPPGETQMVRDQFGQWWLPVAEAVAS